MEVMILIHLKVTLVQAYFDGFPSGQLINLGYLSKCIKKLTELSLTKGSISDISQLIKISSNKERTFLRIT